MNARFPVRACILGASLLLSTWARAADLDFAGGLSSDERDATGISHLSSSEAAVLNGLVAQDVTLARDGGVTGFSSGFCERHWERERLAAGLGRLSATERAALDRYAARAIALGPPPDAPFSYSPPKSAPAVSVAKAAPPPNAIVSTLEHMEVHGDVSLTVGAGSHGSSFYGTSMDLTATDPSGKFTIGVGFSNYHGKGLLALCGPDGGYAPYLGAPYGPYGPYGPALATPGYLDW